MYLIIKLIIKLTGMIAVATMLSLAALAGTKLRFVTGVVDSQNLKMTLSQSESLSKSLSKSLSEIIIQFKNPITEKNKADLRKAGFKIYRYLPDDALILKGSAEGLLQVRSWSSVQTILPFQGSFKVSTNFPNLSIFTSEVRQNVLVTAFSPEDANNILLQLKSQDDELQVLDLEGRWLAVSMKSSLIATLAMTPGIEFVEPMPAMKPMTIDLSSDEITAAGTGDYTDLSGYETGTKVMNFDAIWAQGYYGEGQTVAMADTGLDSGNKLQIHSDFQGAVKSGYSFGVGAKTWDDPMGHGTHVTGSVLGRGIASGGKLTGGAPRAQMVVEGMWSPIIDNLTVPPKLNKLFEAAYADEAKIHTNSWGSGQNFGAYDSMAQQVDDFMWNHPDFLVLYAAGNSGVDANKDGVIDGNSIGSPGTAKNALTVGASENLVSQGGIQKHISELNAAKDHWSAEPIWSSKLSDNIEGLAMFSSRGPTTDGRTKPEIVAPGTNILSVKSSLLKPEENFWGAYSKDYMFSGGTSMATPLVASAAAVVREVLQKKMGISNPSSALVKATLLHTAHDMYPGQYGTGAGQELKTIRPNNDEGYGRVNMGAVAQMDQATRFVDSLGVAQGESFDVDVVVSEDGSLAANLVYSDAPGTPAAGAALVNDLDLTINNVGPNDHINNHEVIELSHLKAGTYRVSVKGNKIPLGKGGKQPFALVYTAH